MAGQFEAGGVKPRKRAHRSRASLLPGVRLDKNSGRAAYWQLYVEIKRRILDGVIPSGAAMPSPRLAAAEFGCSRHTVATSYEYLVAEGLLSARHGVGTFVAPLVGVPLPGASALRRRDASESVRVSRFAEALEQGRIDRDEEDPLQTFGIPDASGFPYPLWCKLYASVWTRPGAAMAEASSAQGFDGLRATICTFVHRLRGISAGPDQVVITAGTTQSVDLLLRALLDPGDEVWVEDPGRPKAAALIRAMGMRLVPVPVDDAGLRVDVAESRAPAARAVLVTPSHHYPTGATLSLERRLRLLAWAQRTGGWVFEDDYDGELIADARPLLPVYSLGATERTIYLGTFSKSISPQLRLGYIICDRILAQRLARLRYNLDYFPAMTLQPVLAEFIERGHLDTYIRRMRRVYRERQSAFAAALSAQGRAEFELFGNAPALFQPLGLKGGGDPLRDRRLAALIRRRRIPAFSLSSFYFEAPPRPGIIVGTGRLPAAAAPQAAADLVAAARNVDVEPGAADV
jgi:GntR family transcriptional regulator/MocR family aminotransferase